MACWTVLHPVSAFSLLKNPFHDLSMCLPMCLLKKWEATHCISQLKDCRPCTNSPIGGSYLFAWLNPDFLFGVFETTKENSTGDQTDLVSPFSGVSPQHRLRGTPGGSDLPVCGHQGRDHHPHQHCGQSRWRPRRHVQGLVRAAVQLDSEPHQHPAAAWHKYMVSSCLGCASTRMLGGAFCSRLHLNDGAWHSVELWWPFWKSVKVDANILRRISMGEAQDK